MDKIIFAITGASGPILGLRVLKELIKHREVHLIISTGALNVLKEESDIHWCSLNHKDLTQAVREYLGSDTITLWEEDNLAAPISSGSFDISAMAIVPCSMKTLAGIATGYSQNLIQRSADVTIKEGRQLVLCPRETPLSPIHLENMLKLSRIGVRIVPPVAGFYHKPNSLDDMLDFMAGKILDAIGVKHSLYNRWGDR